MLRGAPGNPGYQREQAPPISNQLGLGDTVEAPLTGSRWSHWTQTDWAGGFNQLKFKDDATFKEGARINVLDKFGQVTLQKDWRSAMVFSGGVGIASNSFNPRAAIAANGNLYLGISVATDGVGVSSARVYSWNGTNASLLSAMGGIDMVLDMTSYKGEPVLGMLRGTAGRKTIAKITSANVLSGFNSSFSQVNTVHGFGDRLYITEGFAGTKLHYTSDLATFTSAYSAGGGKRIIDVFDLNGSIYFLEYDNASKTQLYQFDEVSEKAYLIYTWHYLYEPHIEEYNSQIIIVGGNNTDGLEAYSFNGSKITQILKDQILMGTTNGPPNFYPLNFYNRIFQHRSYLYHKDFIYDNQVFAPGARGPSPGDDPYIPFIAYKGDPYAYAVSGEFTSAGKFLIAYQDESATNKYETSGHVISSEFGADIGGVDKLINAVDLDMEPLASGQTVEAFLSTDGGDTFTSIGKTSFAQDGAVKKKTLYFPSGHVTRLWNYKVQLVGPGTSTPTVKGVTFQYRPIPDLKKRWRIAVDAGDQVKLLNKQDEERDGKTLVQDLWLEMENKRNVVFEDLDAFEVNIVSAMTSAATSARVADTRLMPPRGRMRVRKSGVVEEMTYTSADGGRIRGITRGRKGTTPRAYTSADTIDNFYNVIVTDIQEAVNTTDETKTESVARVVMLEA